MMDCAYDFCFPFQLLTGSFVHDAVNIGKVIDKPMTEIRCKGRKVLGW
jgi:hypothetical protein